MIDTHCHIDEEAFDADREEVILRQREAGVRAMIVPGINAASIRTVLDVCHAHPGFCFPALGLHPEDVKDDWQTQLATIEHAIRNHRQQLVAIGEIGLDYYWDRTYKEAQQQVLRHQLLLARELDLPVILHNREATEDILTIVKEITNHKSPITNHKYEALLRGVFHCFSGSRETAQIILDLGFYLGIGGVFTFKNSRLSDTIAELNQKSKILNPKFEILDRLLLETDAPYMAPVPHRGERNESRYIQHVANRIAETLLVTPDEVMARTTANARTLFRL